MYKDWKLEIFTNNDQCFGSVILKWQLIHQPRKNQDSVVASSFCLARPRFTEGNYSRFRHYSERFWKEHDAPVTTNQSILTYILLTDTVTAENLPRSYPGTSVGLISLYLTWDSSECYGWLLDWRHDRLDSVRCDFWLNICFLFFSIIKSISKKLEK